MQSCREWQIRLKKYFKSVGRWKLVVKCNDCQRPTSSDQRTIIFMYKFLKRFIDLLLATIALIILSPILIPCIIILMLTGEHEVFYFQKRLGYKNRSFYIWKFATMM